MRTVNSPSLQTVTRYGDEPAFWEWLAFYRRNKLFGSLEGAAKAGNVNVVAVFDDWPPMHPGEWQTFERVWFEYWYASDGATKVDEQERVRKRHPLPNYPTYARSRFDAEKELGEARRKREEEKMARAS